MTAQAPDYYVILNANAGTAEAGGVTADSLAALFQGHDLAAQIDGRCDVPLPDRIADAMASGAGTIVAAGGDGTITALAAALVDTDRTLAILPLGTVNALAKDLQVPLDIEAAIAALATGESHHIDVGEVNGRIFLHKVVIGTIPGVAAAREHIRGRHDAATKIGFLRYFHRRLLRTRRMAVIIDPGEGERRIERVQALAVASNAYDEGIGQFFSRSILDGGSLSLYVLRHLNTGDVLRLTIGMLLGNWQHDEALSVETVSSVTIDTRKDLLKVMFDGEVETMHTPLHFTIRPKALCVLVPASVEATVEAA